MTLSREVQAGGILLGSHLAHDLVSGVSEAAQLAEVALVPDHQLTHLDIVQPQVLQQRRGKPQLPTPPQPEEARCAGAGSSPAGWTPTWLVQWSLGAPRRRLRSRRAGCPSRVPRSAPADAA